MKLMKCWNTSYVVGSKNEEFAPACVYIHSRSLKVNASQDIGQVHASWWPNELQVECRLIKNLQWLASPFEQDFTAQSEQGSKIVHVNQHLTCSINWKTSTINKLNQSLINCHITVTFETNFPSSVTFFLSKLLCCTLYSFCINVFLFQSFQLWCSSQLLYNTKTLFTRIPSIVPDPEKVDIAEVKSKWKISSYQRGKWVITRESIEQRGLKIWMKLLYSIQLVACVDQHAALWAWLLKARLVLIPD